jgi:Asp-tRNA(Asn)/Glu-tRNA(Gln) amidotransferase A subunit family amidase
MAVANANGSRTDHTRRQFMAYCSSAGLATTLLPGVLWAKMQEAGAKTITAEMVRDALAVAGLEFTDEEREQLVDGLNQNLERYENIRGLDLDALAPPLYFSPLVPGTTLDRVARPMRPSRVPALKKPGALEEVAFAPIAHLAHLIKTRQVTSVALTEMYLARLKRYNPTLNCVVTFTDDLAMKQARQADQEIAAGKYRGPLHGIPWGCKDIIAVPGYPTTWGSDAFREQVLETEATVVRLLREAGAVMIAKLTTGELAAGDRWFGGRTNSPWNPNDGSSGSSAGPAAATAAGCVAFGIGTETSGSILSPATACGVTGLRPTFGRVSRYGCMTLSWSQDRVGPICRTVEDCAFVFSAIARPDEQDLSVIDLPFNWDAGLDLRKLRVGYFRPGFEETGREADWRKNDEQALDILRDIGITPEPFDLSSLTTILVGGSGGILGAESAASFDAFLRSGRASLLTNKQRANGFRQNRLIPAVEYLQAQRARALLMRQFADVVGRFDVYVAPYMAVRGGSGAPTPSASGSRRPPQPPSAIRDHFQVANVCGYPAVSVPSGFTTEGKPMSITFLGRLHNEAQILALAKAYQDRAGWLERKPTLTN